MFSLIRFEGDSNCRIYKTSLLRLDSSGAKYCTKYNGSKYLIEKLFATDERGILEELMFNLNNGIPLIEIEAYKDCNSAQSLSAPESFLNGGTHLEDGDSCDSHYFPTSSDPSDMENEAVEKLGSVEAASTRDLDEDDDVCDPNYCPSSSDSSDDEYQTVEENICFSDLYDQYNENCNINNKIDTDVVQGQLGCNDNEQTCSSYQKPRDSLLANDGQLNVSISDGLAKSSQTSNKRHSCYYCGKLNFQIARHLTKMHSNENHVKAALIYEKGSKNRKILLEKIRKLGDQAYNRLNDEKITVGKIKKSTTVCCPFCAGFYSKDNLRNHIRVYCKFKVRKSVTNQGMSRVMLANINPNTNQFLRELVFPHIRNPHYFKVITQDETMVLFGNIYANKYLTTHGHHDKMIAQNLRLIARIFLDMSANNPKIEQVRDVINAAHYDVFVNSVKKLAGSTEGGFKSPSLIHAACGIMRHLATFLKCEAIRQNNDEDMRIVERFQYLLEKQQNADLTKAATEKRTDNQRKKNIIVPTTDEINNLLITIESEIQECYLILSQSFEIEAWKRLSKYILIYTMIFCRKRPGDIERLEVVEFERSNVVDNEFINTLENSDRNLANFLARCVTRGKLNHMASILFSKEHVKGISLVLKYREMAGVPKNNKYLFADPGAKRSQYWRVADELKRFCRLHDFDENKLTATKCRYHLASSTARFEHDHQNVISKFMGHAPQIHNSIYQKPLIQNDVCVMGAILMACNGFANETFSQSIQPVAEITKDMTTTWLDKDEHLGGQIENRLVKNTKEYKEKEMNNRNSEPSLIHLSPIAEESETLISTPSIPPSSPSTRNIPVDGVNATEISSTPKRPRKNNFYDLKRLTPISKLKKTWTTPERHLIRKVFRDNYKSGVLPTIHQCVKAGNNNVLNSRSPFQIQAWIRADLKRQLEPPNRRSWTTPQREKCRQHFRKYYEKTAKLTYPSKFELLEAIETIPELRNKSVEVIRSHLQHDFKYVRSRILMDN